jgi:hypothetical protein
MTTYYVDKETAMAIWRNAHWFADYKFSSRKLGDDRYAVTTDYVWAGSTERNSHHSPDSGAV